MSVALMIVGLVAAVAQAEPAASALEQAERLQSGTDNKPGGEISKAQAEAALANCGVRRFESSAEGLIDGRMRRTSIRLCATDAEANAAWLSKLEKALAQVEEQPKLPEGVKLKLATDLRAEISRLQEVRPATALIPPRPSLLINPQPDSATPEPGRAAAPAATATAAPPAVPAVLARKPKVSIRCRAPGDPVGGAECNHMMTDTVLVVSAVETVPANSVLRFRRSSGRPQADVTLARGLRKGQTISVKIPKPICARVFRTEFDVDVVPAGGTSIIDSHGPFTTRC